MANKKKNTLQVVDRKHSDTIINRCYRIVDFQKRANNELVQEFNLKREDLENQDTDFAKQYDELKLTVFNDSLFRPSGAGTTENAAPLLEELRTVKKYQCHRNTPIEERTWQPCVKVMIGYINQIDSLSRLTTHQKEVIADVTRKYNVASQQISSLAEEKKKT